VGDTESAVTKNLSLAAARLGVPSDGIYFLSQVHGRTAHVVREGADRREVLAWEGDAIVGRSPESAIGVRIADCVPILLGDRRSGATAAIHAGWKGLVAKVIESGVERLRDVVGHQGDLVAAIGPHIGEDAFEVSEDVASTLAACAPSEDVVRTRPGGKPHVALARIARAHLVALGLSPSSIDVVGGCTHAEPADFFSFRRDGARSGRQLAAIVPRGD
jgi:YfiH family protein